MAHETNALIVGGGPAGAALAVHLARHGQTVEILEQSASMHHKVCGEFLSREALAYIEELGIDLRALGAVPIHGVRLAARRQIAECELPFPAFSLTRWRLDEALLSSAAEASAVVLRGRRVERLAPSPKGWIATVAGGETHCAPNAFLASGKHDIGGHRRPPGKQNELVAFKMYFRLVRSQQQELTGWVELIVFRGGYAGLQLTEDGDANLCLVLHRSELEECGNRWATLLNRLRISSGHLAQRLEQAQPLLAKPLALSSIPYGMLHSRPEHGLWRLGDQAAVIPSFCGDGMSIALHSARLAASIYVRGGTASDLSRQLRIEFRGPMRLATAISRMLVSTPKIAELARVWPRLLGVIAARTRIRR